MKKNFFTIVFTILVGAIFASCSSSRNSTKIGETPTVMSEADLKQILGPGYYQDSIIKKLHLFNTADVVWRAESQENKTFVDFKDSKVLSTKNRTKDVLSGFLPAGTEGQVDSVVRYLNTKNIEKIKVKYIIKQNGQQMHIWYYRLDRSSDPSGTIMNGPDRWYQSKDKALQTVDGTMLTRTTLDNKLEWIFSLETKNKTNKNGFDVVSPFASTSPATANPAVKDTANKKKIDIED